MDGKICGKFSLDILLFHGASYRLERAKDQSVNQTANEENCTSRSSYAECPFMAISGLFSAMLRTSA